ncbi:MAG: rRNA maturation RNase YbeY [Alphaproteobacteria bacterium]|nr:rRNA maturation RNase YbeY [Alphaproteobacteria bacterium]
MTRITVNIDKASDKWNRAFPLMASKIAAAVTEAFLQAKKPAAFGRRAFEVNVVLTDDSNVKTLNKNYRGKNRPTNVLSFPQFNLQKFRRAALDIFPAKSGVPLGDIVLAFQTIRAECHEQEKSLENHVTHLIVHGTLHLLGYDHMRTREAEAMEKLECDILASLGYPDPYHEKSRLKKIKH